MRWLADGSADSVAAAVRVAAPGLAGESILVRQVPGREEPLWQASSARLGDDHIAKFAWSEPAARRVAHEIDVLAALHRTGVVPFLPQVVASGLEPVLLITRRVAGASLFEVVDGMDLDRAGRQLARFLGALHHESTKDAVVASLGRVDDASAGLRLVLDYENVSTGEAEYDLRVLPGTGPGVDLLLATVAHYATISRRRLDLDRIMAWHLRIVLADALWRIEAGVPLPDHRTAGVDRRPVAPARRRGLPGVDVCPAGPVGRGSGTAGG